MIAIKNIKRILANICVLLILVSCEDDFTNNTLEGYENIPTNLNLTYSLNTQSSGYVVDFEGSTDVRNSSGAFSGISTSSS